MQLQNVVTGEHIEKAVNLFTVSTMDAANSGLLDSVAINDEQRQEMINIEEQIKRRVAFGACSPCHYIHGLSLILQIINLSSEAIETL